jgi:hypothetical protein
VLSEEIIPAPGAPWFPDINEFALTFDAYQALGGFDAVGDLANRVADDWHQTGRLPEDLVELRSCLFFEQRRYHHFGHGPSEEDMPYLWALLEAIRQHCD